MIFLYPNCFNPFISPMEVAMSGEPSSMPGRRWECMSAVNHDKSTVASFFFPKKNIVYIGGLSEYDRFKDSKYELPDLETAAYAAIAAVKFLL